MATVSSRDRATFTSGGIANPSNTFRVNIESGDEFDSLGVFDTLRIDAHVLENESELDIDVSDRVMDSDSLVYQDTVTVSEDLIIKQVSTLSEVPSTFYVPNSSTKRIQPSFDVARGPLHPQKSVPVPIRVTVMGFYNRKDDNGVSLGSTQILLEG